MFGPCQLVSAHWAAAARGRMSGVTRDKVDLHSALPLHNTSQQEIFHTLWCQTLNCQPTFCWLRLVVSFWYSKMIIWCLEEILLSYWDIVILYRVLLKAAGVQIQFIIAQHIRYTSSLEQEQRHTWGQTSNWVLVLSGVMATVSVNINIWFAWGGRQQIQSRYSSPPSAWYSSYWDHSCSASYFKIL